MSWKGLISRMSDECLMKQETVFSFYIVYQAVMRKFTLAGKSILLFASVGMCECVRCNVFLHLVNDFQQVLTILVLQHRLCYFAHSLLRNPTVAVGNSFKTSDLQTLAFLYYLHKGGCFSKAIMCTSI